MRKHILTFCGLIFYFLLFAQGTVENYQRAFSLSERFRDKVFYSDVNPRWINNTSSFWYLQKAPDSHNYLLVNADTRSRTALFDAQLLADALNEAGVRNVRANRLDLQNLQVSSTTDTLTFSKGSKNWRYIRSQQSLTEETVSRNQRNRYWGSHQNEREGRPQTSPDQQYSAFVRDHNVVVKDIVSGEEKILSTDGSQEVYYSTNIRWSPDSRKLAVIKIRGVEVPQITFVESSPSDQLQPKVHTRDYFKPGDSLAHRIPVIFDISTGNAITASDALFRHQYSLSRFEWTDDSRHFLFEYNQRGHQVYRVLELNASTGKVRPIIEETSPTFVNYNRYFQRKLKNGKEIIWMSERDNWNHLYLYDRATGKVKQQITKGPWYVREIIDVDEEKREIIFSANGMIPTEDPYLIRYYRIGFNGKGLTCLTPEEGMHQAWFSSDKKYLVDVYSMVNQPPVAVLRSARDGKIVMELEKADISALLQAGWIAPEPFVAKGRDGTTDIWGVIIRPTDFDPQKSYPIIEYIYAGPGSHYTPKSFFTINGNMSPLAELGFIVIQLDGMGTSFRSKAFEDVCFQNLKDAGFPDRIAWTKAAAAKYPYMDIERVGIFGASAGGQESMAAVLHHAEHYKAAYSSCGCHDNRMDKIWWNEQWMGFPIGKQYEESSNVVNAHLLTRPLMLVVGELDDNVDPASTMQVANALIKAKKDFELIVLPGVGHTMGGEYGEHKRYDFFVKHLHEVLPPKWELVKK